LGEHEYRVWDTALKLAALVGALGFWYQHYTEQGNRRELAAREVGMPLFQMRLRLVNDISEAAAIIATAEVESRRFKEALFRFHTIIAGPALLFEYRDETVAKIVWKFVHEVDERMKVITSGRLDPYWDDGIHQLAQDLGTVCQGIIQQEAQRMRDPLSAERIDEVRDRYRNDQLCTNRRRES
jgi:hypothetical protein